MVPCTFFCRLTVFPCFLLLFLIITNVDTISASTGESNLVISSSSSSSSSSSATLEQQPPLPPPTLPTPLAVSDDVNKTNNTLNCDIKEQEPSILTNTSSSSSSPSSSSSEEEDASKKYQLHKNLLSKLQTNNLSNMVRQQTNNISSVVRNVDYKHHSQQAWNITKMCTSTAAKVSTNAARVSTKVSVPFMKKGFQSTKNSLSQIHYKNHTMHVWSTTKHFTAALSAKKTLGFLRDKTKAVTTTYNRYIVNRLSRTPKGNQNHEKIAIRSSKCMLVGGLLGIALLLSITGPLILGWWTDECLREKRLPSCGSVVAASATLGFTLGREIGFILYYFLHTNK